MDAVVQLIRNALCCVKDLKLFPDSFIHDASVTAFITQHLPPPMDKTTPLEVLISITQLYACLSIASSGYNLLVTSIGKLNRINRLLDFQQAKRKQQQQQQQSKDNKTTDPIDNMAESLVNDSLFKEGKYAFRSVIIGALVAPLGVCFWWLFINSWHITETDWFGGLPALINALTVMEICLFPLLYFMIVDGRERLAKSEKYREYVKNISDQEYIIKHSSGMTLMQYEAMTKWVPFWDTGVGWFTPVPNPKVEEKQLDDEKQKVKDQLSKIVTVTTAAATATPAAKNDGEKKKSVASDNTTNKDDEKEKDVKIKKETVQHIVRDMDQAAPILRMEGYREFVYFVLNFVAFYGYLMGPLTYYYEHEDLQPSHVKSMKFYYNNSDADWHGNFAGDLMWTIEPVIILGSPFIMAWMKQSSLTTTPPPKKAKKETKAD